MVGDGRRLYRHLDDLRGVRGIAERMAMRGRWRDAGAVSNARLADGWARVSEVVGAVDDALLIDTSYYKAGTVFCGVVAPRGAEAVFVKAFAAPHDHESEVERHDLLQSVRPASVRLADLLAAQDGVVTYKLLPRARYAARQTVLLRTAFDLALTAWRDAPVPETGGAGRPANDEAAELALAYGMSDRTVAAIDAVDVADRAVAHGDFTQWNAFETGASLIGLVDYERVGYRAPFTDVWHLFVQDRALRGRIGSLRAVVERVGNVATVTPEVAAGWCAAYLVEELRQDLRDAVVDERSHPQLATLIAAKAGALCEVSPVREGLT
jgi:hypothetical protein